jgi:hypothetical protein
MLLLLTVCARRGEALQYQPLDIYSNGHEECALIISGPGRSSLYDYTYNLLRGGLLYVFHMRFAQRCRTPALFRPTPRGDEDPSAPLTRDVVLGGYMVAGGGEAHWEQEPPLILLHLDPLEI